MTAQGIEAGTVETAGLDRNGESPVRQDAPYIQGPPVRDNGPLETMAMAFRNADTALIGELDGNVPRYYFVRAREAITALSEAGYAIVPIEPTPEMAKVGVYVAQTGAVLGAWGAMVRAAPLATKEGE